MNRGNADWNSQRLPRRSRNGRGRVMAMLDRLMADQECREVIREALTAEMQKHPVRFFRTVIVPLLPRDEKLTDEGRVVVGWRSLLSAPAALAKDGSRKGKVQP